MNKSVKLLLVLCTALLGLYLLGPTPDFEKVDNVPFGKSFLLSELDSLIEHTEDAVPNIKEDNRSKIVWADSIRRTEYSLVYLHGFSASHGEAHPILQNFAERYGCNLYLPRLYRHGLDDVDAFATLTPKGLVDSAREAIAIGKAIGNKTIIMSTSTGSTLAAFLASGDPDIHALICTSPNFDIYDSKSHLLVKPWGKQIFRYMMGGNYREWDSNPEVRRYWTTKNRIEGHIALRSLLNQTMKAETFRNIDIPVYIGYYYKNEIEQDKIISIDAIHRFSAELSTPVDAVRIVPFSNASRHVISSQYMNPNWPEVQTSIFNFADEVLGMQALGEKSESIE